MLKWRNINPFNRKRKKKRGAPALESRSGQSQQPAQRQPSRYPNYRGGKRKSRRTAKLFLLRAFIIVAVVGGGYLGYIYATLPNIDKLGTFTKAPSILIKSEDGQIIGSFGDIYGDYIPFSELPSSLVDAVIATEDRNFYHHFGVDPFGLLRAAFADIRARHLVQGGSTITQQVAKNVFLTPERSFVRKLREMMLAIKLERRYSKEDIISIYLNRVYLGAGNYGVDAASRRYFDTPAREMTLPESAIMAGLLKAPSRFAPTSDPKRATKRAEQVLLNMQDAGYLTEKQATKARAELDKNMSGRQRMAQSTLYFADWVMDELPQYIGNVQDDLVVTTTLNPRWQMLAEKAVNDVMDKEAADHNVSQAAMVSMTPDGAIRAMIGGRSYAASQYNRATQAERQPGSSFKLFVYLAALEAGYTPDSLVEDKPISVKVAGGYWEPKNYNNKFLGTVTLKEAVAESINTVAVQVAESVGLGNVIAMAQRLGITSDMDPLPSIALGSTEVSLLELTTAYAHLAANGAAVYPYGIVAIDTTKGDPVYRRETTGGMALRPGVVEEMNQLLLGVVQNGTGKAANIGRPAAGKTGTTSDYRDAWFMGYTPDLVSGVWVGNDDNAEMKKVTGGTLPAKIWHAYMLAALANTPPHDIPTEGGFSLTMPWENGAPGYPAQPGTRQKARPEGGNALGQSFWDKLLGR